MLVGPMGADDRFELPSSRMLEGVQTDRLDPEYIWQAALVVAHLWGGGCHSFHFVAPDAEVRGGSQRTRRLHRRAGRL